MKKLLALMLTICMMILFPAAVLADNVLQDEQPPMLVTRLGENGETIYTVIYDAQGSVIEQVYEEDALVLVDVHDRDAVENEIAKNRLTSAYLDLVGELHPSDAQCLLHEHSAKADIDEILANLGMDIDAYDLLACELFDVCLADELDAKMTEGCSAELMLAVKQNETPLIALFTQDGAKWQVLPIAGGSDSFTVMIPGAGTMALLCAAQGYAVVTEEQQPSVTTEEGDHREDDFTPSPGASGKPSPQLITGELENGETVIGYIGNTTTGAKNAVLNRDEVVITAVAESDSVADILAYEHIEWAYDSILAAADVGDLACNNPEGTIAADLDAAMQQMGSDLTHDQLVVKDLFEVSVYGDSLNQLHAEDAYLELTFDPGLDSGMTLIAIQSNDSVCWKTFENEDAIINADGTVTLRLHNLGVVAFLVEAEYDIDVEGAVQAP